MRATPSIRLSPAPVTLACSRTTRRPPATRSANGAVGAGKNGMQDSSRQTASPHWTRLGSSGSLEKKASWHRGPGPYPARPCPLYEAKCSGSEVRRRIRQTDTLALGGQQAPVRCRDTALLVVPSERELGRSGDAWISRKAAATAASPDMLKSPRVPPARPRTHELSSARAGSSKDSRGFGGLEW